MRAPFAPAGTPRRACGHPNDDRRMGRLNMPVWKHHLRIGDIFHADMPFPELRDEIVRRIKSARFYDEADYDLTLLVDEIADTEDADDFDHVWDAFYDWCDGERVWVDTTGRLRMPTRGH